MMPIYFIVLVLSGLVPLLYTIYKQDFIKNWSSFTISTIIIATVFLIWDGFFTALGIWGFNPDYILGFNLFLMPLEEFLFFIVIPFCSLFLHYAIFYALPNMRLNKQLTIAVSCALILLSILLVVMNFDKAYTAVNFTFLALAIIVGLIMNIKALQQFYLSFLAILFPFILVNGILTGMATEHPVVWYDHIENLNIRLITIPIEDIGYAFSMLFGNLLIFESLKKRWTKV
ncbi:lycopene cyclase domain-containing protein [Crocinitomix catalasitica]|uniref:lycopene cyclase domain-containing protein n=1 Tax=Crocinitomix catalasitica TaxID=184607 RepID=UPI00055B61F7|nr:lycopene cyclase domain-containing protein [Crocinitomix catalasitica]